MENKELEHRLFIDETMILDNHKKLENLKVDVNTDVFDPTSNNPASQKSTYTAIQTAINGAILTALNTAV